MIRREGSVDWWPSTREKAPVTDVKCANLNCRAWATDHGSCCRGPDSRMTYRPSGTRRPLPEGADEDALREFYTKYWTKPKRLEGAKIACPWCEGTELDAEFVDVGVGGPGVQVTPYHCYGCGATEIGPHDDQPYTEAESMRGWYGPVPERLWEGADNCPEEGCMTTHVCDNCKSRINDS